PHSKRLSVGILLQAAVPPKGGRHPGREEACLQRRVIIMGAAGRDFHNFNSAFRADPATRVVAFTATQIPYIDDRTYPAALAGPAYPEGIPIFPEERLGDLVAAQGVDGGGVMYSELHPLAW